MKKSIPVSSIFGLLFLSSFSFAADPVSPQKDIKFCENEIYRAVEKLDRKGTWEVIPPVAIEDKVYRSATGKIGTWIELKIKPTEIHLIVATAESIETSVFKKGSCKAKPVAKAADYGLPKEGFNDKDLQKLVDEKQDTMIYVWDPAAAHSVRTAKVFLDEAKKRGLKVVSVLGPNADVDWAKKELANNKLNLGLQKLTSLDLIFRGGNLHFPSTFFVGNNRISERLVGGLEASNVERMFNNFQGTKK